MPARRYRLTLADHPIPDGTLPKAAHKKGAGGCPPAPFPIPPWPQAGAWPSPVTQWFTRAVCSAMYLSTAFA